MKHDQFGLTGKIAVITGGGRGIGYAIAEEFAQRGAHIILAGRSIDTLEHAQNELTKFNVPIAIYTLDVSDSLAVSNFHADVIQQHGHVDILVNNAGISPVYAPIDRTSNADWLKLQNVNLSGVFYCCKSFGSSMIKHGSGSIINITSIAGHVGIEKQAAYCATKGGVEQLTKGTALDWADKGVRANSIAYGFVETDLTQGLRDHDALSTKLLERTPMGRFAKTQEVTGAAVFLASDASSYVTGTSIVVDGGWTAR